MIRRRHLKTFAGFLCGAVVLVLIFLWGRSTESADVVSYTRWHYDDVNLETSTKYAIVSRNGSIGLWHYRGRKRAEFIVPVSSEWWWSIAGRDNSVFPPVNRFGFGLSKAQKASGEARELSVGAFVPHWLLIAIFALTLLRGFWLMHRRISRASRGECLSCGYDLGGSGDAARCPECGAAAHASQA
ncbi:MAG: hypothetical protein QOF78_2391 [Phycisphaerales bacterium]|nr:hypothetical protein [Phycisphaerales bacterium]